MAPNTTSDEPNLMQEEETNDKLVAPQASPRKYQIVYFNLLYFGYWQLAAIYGVYLCFTSAKWATILFSYFVYVAAELGITAGAHRLWSHKAYKANRALEIILIVFNSLAFQNSATEWVRDHRMHHKYSDTDADPHNATRGLFFSHIGWLVVKKHPEIIKRGQSLDMSDVYSNPILRFQKKYAIPFIGMICFVLPTVIPMYFWGESLNNAWHIAIMRYTINLHATFLVNSVAHLWGNKPYDTKVMAAQNLFVVISSCGEGYHNYHHVFPWDYRAAELGNNRLNLTTNFIDFFAWLGWAYDLKTVPSEVIIKRSRRTGDGTDLWGNVDPNMQKDTVACEINRVGLTFRGKEIKLGELKHHVYIYRVYDQYLLDYRAYCAGNIIAIQRVLSSSFCFLTNRKRPKYVIGNLRVAAGILYTYSLQPMVDSVQQWRRIKKIYSQRYFRYPANDLAVLEMDQPFIFNQFVHSIPYATIDQDFDGVCMLAASKTAKSWLKESQLLFVEEKQLIKRKSCERTLLRSCYLYYCTAYDKTHTSAYSETIGGGLVCHGTGDPAEVDEKQGVLVSITTLSNRHLPSLHSKIGLFHKWVRDASPSLITSRILVYFTVLCVFIIFL